MAINRAAHPAEMRPMTSGDRALDLLSGPSGMLVGFDPGMLGSVDVVFLVEDVLEEEGAGEEEEVKEAVVDVAGGSGTNVPLTFCFVPMKDEVWGWVRLGYSLTTQQDKLHDISCVFLDEVDAYE